MITGLRETIADLEAIKLERLRDVVASLLQDMAADAGDYSKAPERDGQRYRRTGRLGDGWRDSEPMFQIDGNSLLAEKTNPVSYTAHVMGEGEQTALFADRWRTEGQIIDEWEPTINARIEAALDALVDE